MGRRRHALMAACLASAVTMGSGGAQAAPFDLRAQLEKPKTTLLAVVFYSRECKACAETKAGWKGLADKYGGHGLRTVLVLAKDRGTKHCVSAPFEASASFCDRDGRIAKSLGVSPSEARAFLWAWPGKLLVKEGYLEEVRWEVAPILDAKPKRIPIEAAAIAPGLDLTPDRMLSMAYSAMHLDGRVMVEMQPGTAPNSVPVCKGAIEISDAARVITGVERSGQRHQAFLDLISNSGCSAARATAPMTANDISGAFEKAAARLTAQLVRGIEMPLGGDSGGIAPKRRQQTQEPEIFVDRGDNADRGSKLQDFVDQWVGVRHSVDGTDRSGISGHALIQRFYRDVYGIEIPGTIHGIYRRYPVVHTGLTGAKAKLREGDLLFYTTHADEPRFAAIYIGDGKMFSSGEILGVHVSDLPTEMPNFFWLSVVRILGAE